MIQPFGNIRFFDSQTKISDNFRMYPVICESRTKLPPFQITTNFDDKGVDLFEWIRYNENNITLGESGISGEDIEAKNNTISFIIYDGTTVGVTLPLGFGQFYVKDLGGNEFYSQYILIK